MVLFAGICWLPAGAETLANTIARTGVQDNIATLAGNSIFIAPAPSTANSRLGPTSATPYGVVRSPVKKRQLSEANVWDVNAGQVREMQCLLQSRT